MNESDKEQGYLRLSDEPIRFESVSKVTNVFFDEANKEVLSVRGGGTLGVVVKNEERTLTFCIDHKGTISSIKFSPDHSLLAIQRSTKSVEILNYNDGEISNLLVQECRAKGSNLLGFIWTGPEHIVLVNDHAVEFYQIIKEKSSIRFIKNYSQNTKWFVWSPLCNILLLCIYIAPASATLQPFSFSPGQISKLQKFEVEMSGGATAQQGGGGHVILGERDIYVGILYGSVSVGVLRHPALPTQSAHLDVYTQMKDGIFVKTHLCVLELAGKFAVNIIDSLIVIHHQASKTSLVFDLLNGAEISAGVTSVYPVTLPKPILPYSLEEPGTVPSSVAIPRSIPCQLYSPTWVVFQPDVIIDARLGCMWKLQLYLQSLPPLVEDKAQLIDVLLRRKGAKPLVMAVVKELITKSLLAPLDSVFDKINAIYRQHLNSVMQSQMGECVNGSNGISQVEVIIGSVIVDQVDMYSQVFAPLMEQVDKNEENVCDEVLPQVKYSIKNVVSSRLMVGVALDYIRSLNGAGISIQHFINELVINGLVRTRQFYQLHQLLQYHVLSDSKPLACLLLSLVGVYSAGEQLSLDMLSRLNTAHDEITEVLLSHKLVIQALRYVKSVGQSESISARKFLEVAMASEDPLVFYSTYKFFSLRNASLRGHSSFAKSEHCEVYFEHYKKLFGENPPEYT